MVPATAVSSPPVTAVLVCHDGARWLPQVLAALSAQTHPPDRLLAVDTGSADDTVAQLTAALGADQVLATSRDTGFGDAVARAMDMLAERDTAAEGWIWLLHDDCTPAADALQRLLAHAQAGSPDEPPVAIIGPKVREWPSLRRLLEVGATISGTGTRETGLERGEPDQGQRDDPRQVLAVGTAGALVRAAAWESLDGLEPQLPLFGDDLDFGWRATRAGWQVQVAPAAVVFHAEAATRGQRTPGVLSGSARRGQRRAALFVLLANCRGSALAWMFVRLLVGSLLRSVGWLLLKAPSSAWDELAAAGSVLGRPWHLADARSRRRRTAQRPPSEVRPLLPSAVHPYREGAAAVADVVGGLLAPTRLAAPRSVAEPGPVAEEAEALPPEPGPLARVAARPWASAVLALVVLTLLTSRAVLTGGELQGGALLPAPEGAGDWWSAYTAGWHPVGTGSTEPSPPYVLMLAGSGLLTLGDAGAAVSLLLLGAPVLAGLTAHRLLRLVGAGPLVAVWAAMAYAAVPLATGAIAQGRLGTVLATVVAPLLVSTTLSVAAADSSPGTRGRLERWVRRSRAGLMAAVLVALVPVAWPLLVLIAIGTVSLVAVTAARRVSHPPLVQVLLSAAVIVSVPWLLGPQWLAARLADPWLWWWEAGLPDARVGPLDPGPVELALGMPGGPGGIPAWVGAGVLVAAVAALARTGRRRHVLVAWSVATLALVLAAVGVLADPGAASRTDVTAIWVGFPLAMWWGSLLIAAAIGAHDLEAMLAARSFGWRQLGVAGVAAVALVSPVLALGWSVAHGVDAPLRRDVPTPVPAYMADDASSGTRASTVILAATEEGIDTTVVRADGWRLGEEPMRAAAAPPVLVEALTGLLAVPTEENLQTISRLGIGYLYLPGPVAPDLSADLDSAPGLVRAGAPERDLAWRLTNAGGTLQVDGLGVDIPQARGDGGPPWTATPSASPQRLLRVAAAADRSWQASVGGRELSATDQSEGLQTFAVAAPGDGPLTVDFASSRAWWVAAQLVCLLALLLLAAPTRPERG